LTGCLYEVLADNVGGFMPSRARLDEFIAVVEAGDHAGAIERYYTEDSSMQENAAPPRVGRDLLVAHERGVLARMSHVYSKVVSSTLEGDRVAIHWIFELTDKSGKVLRIDEVSLQEWRGDKIFRERFFYDPSRPKT
jgi:hypothetical protein